LRPLGLAKVDTPEKPFSLSPQDLTYISAGINAAGLRPQKTPRECGAVGLVDGVYIHSIKIRMEIIVTAVVIV
jgi:hypothetical protein